MIPKYTAAGSCRLQKRACARILVPAVVVSMAAVLSLPAFAETSYYGGISISRVEYEVAGETLGNLTYENAEWDLAALSGRLGKQFHKNFSAEMRLGIGVSDDSTDVNTTNATNNNLVDSLDVEVELEYFIGGYLRAGVPLGGLYPYLIAGYTNAEFEYTADDGFSADGDDSDFSYGVGTDIQFSDNMGANLEWMQYYDKDNTEISAFQLGIVRRF